MLKSLRKSNTYISPFVTFKDWTLSNIENVDVLLDEADEGIILDYIDYGDGSGIPVWNSDCLIALEQQADDKATIHEGLSRKGLFYPDVEPTNPDGTFKRVVYNQTKLMFYNHYLDPTKIYGLENIDFPKSKTNKFLAEKIKVFNIPARVFGEKIIENSVNLMDNSLDNVHSIQDDGNNNLFAGRDLFSKQQEVGDFINEFVTGSISSCADYFNFSVPDAPISLSVSSGSSILSWSYMPHSPSLRLEGFGVQRSIGDETNYQLLGLVGSASVASFLDTTPEQTVNFYRVYAFNTFGISAYASGSINFGSAGSIDFSYEPPEAIITWIDGGGGPFTGDRAYFYSTVFSAESITVVNLTFQNLTSITDVDTLTALYSLQLNNNIALTGPLLLPPLITDISVEFDNFSPVQVGDILQQLVDNNQLNGLVVVRGQVTPFQFNVTGTDLANIATLEGRGWTVLWEEQN